jgi:hypothetical protein
MSGLLPVSWFASLSAILSDHEIATSIPARNLHPPSTYTPDLTGLFPTTSKTTTPQQKKGVGKSNTPVLIFNRVRSTLLTQPNLDKPELKKFSDSLAKITRKSELRS